METEVSLPYSQKLATGPQMRQMYSPHTNSLSSILLHNRPEVAVVPGDVSPTPPKKKKLHSNIGGTR
jgi:hypothetical protein